MKSRYVLSHLVVLSLLFASMSGCSKNEEASPTQEEPAPETDVQAAGPETSDLEAFLDASAGVGTATAGDQIGKFFDFWGYTLRQHPRKTVDVHFEVTLDGTFKEDYSMKDKTIREFLDGVCAKNDLAWAIEEPNTIRIAKAPQ